jgi:phosphoglycerol transferase MdoB-like AlkP superfamily enzyme
MAHDVASMVTAGIVALAFLLLVGSVVWRLTATVPSWTARILIALAGVLAGLPAVLYALLSTHP